MVPIHDTDVAEERWARTKWENYELWEKVEVRLKRQRRIWILGTAFLFLILSAVPILLESWPKWMTRSIARRLAQEINLIKREASIHRAAYRLKIQNVPSLGYVVERTAQCSSASGEAVRNGDFDMNFHSAYTWVFPMDAAALDVPGLVTEFCYDYLSGNETPMKNQDEVGFAIVPVKDLMERRIDRMTILLLSGKSAEISFD